MPIFCPTCDAKVPAEEVNLERLVARCLACDEVFSFAEQLGISREEAAGIQPRGPVPKPERLKVEDLGNELIISYRWFTVATLALLFFCIFWDGFMIVWYTIALTQQIWLMAAFGLLHLAVGVGLTYFVIGSFLNSTIVRASKDELSVTSGPVPFGGNRTLAATEVDQLYCTETLNVPRSNGYGMQNRRSAIQYALVAVLKDGSEVKLIGDFQTPIEALFVEQALERHLGILDRPVGGELSR